MAATSRFLARRVDVGRRRVDVNGAHGAGVEELVMDRADATADVEESGVGGQRRLDGVEQQACRSHRAATSIASQLALSEATVEFTFDTLALATGHRSCVVASGVITSNGGWG